MFLERLGSYRRDIFYYNGSSGSGRRPVLLWFLDGKAAILAYIFYLPYKTEFSNNRRFGKEYFKNRLTVSNDNTCSVKDVDL